MKKISSSYLNSLNYDYITKVLEIEFHSGEIRKYSGVPEKVYKELFYADSHGTYYNKCIKDIYPLICKNKSDR